MWVFAAKAEAVKSNQGNSLEKPVKEDEVERAGV